jgi:hypothetical protein
MAEACAYAVVRERDGSYRLDRITEPFPGRCATIQPLRDRGGAITDWKLKKLVCMQGAASRIWTSPAEAIAATKLMKPGQAKTAIAQADVVIRP